MTNVLAHLLHNEQFENHYYRLLYYTIKHVKILSEKIRQSILPFFSKMNLMIVAIDITCPATVSRSDLISTAVRVS